MPNSHSRSTCRFRALDCRAPRTGRHEAGRVSTGRRRRGRIYEWPLVRGFFASSRSDFSSSFLRPDAGPSLVRLARWARSLSSGCCSPRPVRAMPCVSLCLLMPASLTMQPTGCPRTCSNIRWCAARDAARASRHRTGRVPLPALTTDFWNGRMSPVVIPALSKGVPT
jgi:hypothetical protein